ncbi:MAG: hypothetical protein LUD72_07745 [Bacteroidales bacterium]|nr:hypothetical protein [Bacteroidales bacterium]
MNIKDSLKKWWSKFSSEDKAGIYFTATVHLFLLAVLLIIQIGRLTFGDNGILVDLSKLEEQEKEVEDIRLKEEVSKKIDDMIRNAKLQVNDEDVRNVVVDRGSKLKDNIGTNVEELEQEAERVQNRLKDAAKEDARDDTVDYSPTEDKSQQKEYKGPSVVSYYLEGRKALNLKIPAYKCLGGGDVTVVITVDSRGTVVDAKVQEAGSSTDACLRDHAIRAAKMSKFTKLGSARPASLDAAGNQIGEIVYRYIPQ